MKVEKQTAELAKIKGFDEPCEGYYDIDKSYRLGYRYCYRQDCQNSELNYGISVPTQSQLQTWLRETHNCLVIVDFYGGIDENDETGFKSKSDIKFKVEIDYYGANFEIEQGEETDYLNYDFDSYEDALEDGLCKALMMLPNENN